jgi:hypothetical protein
MDSYDIALYVHLLCLLLATAATTLAGFAGLQLRSAAAAAEVARWGMFISKVVKAFPVAVLGLLASGAYMTQDRWSWSTPWIDASIAGLALIVALGSGVEARRGRELRDEIRSSGLSPRARRLLRDPIAWSAKGATIALMLGVVFAMTTKPGTAGAVTTIIVALAAGVLAAIPFWRQAPVVAEAAYDPSA